MTIAEALRHLLAGGVVALPGLYCYEVVAGLVTRTTYDPRYDEAVSLREIQADITYYGDDPRAPRAA